MCISDWLTALKIGHHFFLLCGKFQLVSILLSLAIVCFLTHTFFCSVCESTEMSGLLSTVHNSGQCG